MKRLHGAMEEADESKTKSDPDPVILLALHACMSWK